MGWKASSGFTWPLVLMVVVARDVQRRRVEYSFSLFFLLPFRERRHKRTEETLVALKRNKINNLGPNDLQVWPRREPPSASAASSWPLPPTLCPLAAVAAVAAHSPEWEQHYVIASAVGRAADPPQRAG